MKKKLIKNGHIFTFLIFCFGSIICGVLSSFLLDFKLDYFSYTCVDYNSETQLSSTFEPTILNIKKDFSVDEKKQYSDLHNHFYYNMMVGACRQKIDNSISFNLSSSFSVSTQLLTQPTFSIETVEKETGGYYLDYGQYYSYYSDDILGPRGYLSTRFNCDGFVFVSDILADELISFYNIAGDNPYEELITNEDYAVLPVTIDGEASSINLCINNILYSDKRNGDRTQELYDSFALIPYYPAVMNKLDVSFEIDLKTNPYGNKTCFKDINTMGYTIANSSYSIYSYSGAENKYLLNAKLSDDLVKAWSNGNDVLVYSIFIVLFLLGLGSIIYLSIINTKFARKELLSYLLSLGLFVIFGIVCSFIYIYPLYCLFPLSSLLFVYIIKRKEIRNEIKNLFRKPSKANSRYSEEFYQIEI